MQLVDTHCHIFLEDFDSDRDDVITRAKNDGINKLILPNVDRSTLDRLHETCGKYPGTCFPVLGLHPSSVNANFEEELSVIRRELDEGTSIGVGEIGMDLYWDKTFVAEQEQAFISQLGWANELNLPVIIHVRQAFAETFAAIQKSRITGLRGVFHCFSGGLDEAEMVVGMGFLLGIGGVATFKNGGLSDVLTNIPLDKMVLETDAPYLAPTPHRGKRNEPSYMKLVAMKLAEIKGIPLDEVASVTTRNAEQLFDI